MIVPQNNNVQESLMWAIDNVRESRDFGIEAVRFTVAGLEKILPGAIEGRERSHDLNREYDQGLGNRTCI